VTTVETPGDDGLQLVLLSRYDSENLGEVRFEYATYKSPTNTGGGKTAQTTISWGDGTPDDVSYGFLALNGTPVVIPFGGTTHSYAAAGTYTITVHLVAIAIDETKSITVDVGGSNLPLTITASEGPSGYTFKP
jgi:hypothetical protein